MNRAAVLAANVCLACVLAAHAGAATRAMPHRPCATPGATPSAIGQFEVPDAVPVSLLVQNTGADDRLLGGSSPVATSVEAHQTRLVDGRRVMEADPDGIAIPGGKPVILEPAAGHLMLLGLTADLVQGETFPLTLRFERAGEVTVTVRVRRRVDAAGVAPISPVVGGDLLISLASAPPAAAQTAACLSAGDDL